MPEERRGPARTDSAEERSWPDEPARSEHRDDARIQPPRDGDRVDPRSHGRRAYDDRPAVPPRYDQDVGAPRHAGDRDVRPAHAGVGLTSAVGRSSTWGPVLSGAATAFVVFLIFTALWLGIAASGADAVGDNLAWFQLVSGVLAAAAGGAAAGWLDPRGTVTGMIQGLATWGLLLLAVTVTGLTTGTALLGAMTDVTVQADIQVTNVGDLLRPFQAELWALFAILLGGAVIAAFAGAVTGRTHTMLALDDEPRHVETGHR
jgi:hypothetical protein